jgi:hypothetical protein
MRKNRILLVMALVSMMAVATAQAADWSNIGSGTLVFKNPQVVIKVKKSAPPCSEIRVRLTGQMVNVKGVKMIFADGTSQEVDVNTSLRPGVASDPIKVDGGPKALEKVEIAHNAAGRGGSNRATITVQGHG